MPAYGLALPLVPLAWAARAAGHEVLFVCANPMAAVLADAGLTVADACPDRDVWAEFTHRIRSGAPPESEEMRIAAESRAPFAFFALLMTEPTIEIGEQFDAEALVYTSDHMAGPLVTAKLGIPGIDCGNRVSWSTRDRQFDDRSPLRDDRIPELLRERLGIPQPQPPLARIDPRAPSMGGLSQIEPDIVDRRPWLPMRYVPYNGGIVAPEWARMSPAAPRVLVSLGTVVPALHGVSQLAVVLEALSAMDVEVVLATGNADLAELGELPANVRLAGYLPLSAVLPSCVVMVHHGGSGTTAAPLAYGIPQLVLPAFADNFMAADRVADRGVGLRRDAGTLTVDQVRTDLQTLLDEPSYTETARAVAAEIAGMPSPAEVITELARLAASTHTQ